MTPLEFPIVAQESVERLGVSGRLGAAVNYLIFGSKK
jgi:hypothetical protein